MVRALEFDEHFDLLKYPLLGKIFNDSALSEDLFVCFAPVYFKVAKLQNYRFTATNFDEQLRISEKSHLNYLLLNMLILSEADSSSIFAIRFLKEVDLVDV